MEEQRKVRITKELVEAFLSWNEVCVRRGRWPLLHELELNEYWRRFHRLPIADDLTWAPLPVLTEWAPWEPGNDEMDWGAQWEPGNVADWAEVRPGVEWGVAPTVGEVLPPPPPHVDPVITVPKQAPTPLPPHYRPPPDSRENVFSSEEVYTALCTRYPILSELMAIAGDHLFVMGGSVLASCVGLGHHPKAACPRSSPDLDLILVGCSEEEATILLTKMLKCLEARGKVAFPRKDDPEDIEDVDHRVFLSRSQYQVSVWIDVQYQVVLALASSIQEVLASADLQCCGLGFSLREGLVALPLSAFCVVTQINIVDCQRWSKSYEHRLAKYYSKGFSPVFPSLSSSRSLDGEVRFGDFTAVQQVPHCEIAPLREGWWRVLVGDSRDAETTLAPNILKMRLVSDYGLEESMYSGPNLYAGGGEYNRRWAVRQALYPILLSAPTVEELLERPKVLRPSEAKWRAAGHVGTHVTLGELERLYGLVGAEKLSHAIIRGEPTAPILKELDSLSESLMDEAERICQGGVKWHQLTSEIFSAKPRSPASCYPESMYEPTIVGLPSALAGVLVQLRRNHKGFRSLPSDILRVLVWYYIIPAVCEATIANHGRDPSDQTIIVL